jgi:hypothetical protein
MVLIIRGILPVLPTNVIFLWPCQYPPECLNGFFGGLSDLDAALIRTCQGIWRVSFDRARGGAGRKVD